jgi:hypothetical protein
VLGQCIYIQIERFRQNKVPDACTREEFRVKLEDIGSVMTDDCFPVLNNLTSDYELQVLFSEKENTHA